MPLVCVKRMKEKNENECAHKNANSKMRILQIINNYEKKKNNNKNSNDKKTKQITAKSTH